jgi:hypothetical protein
VKQIETVCSVFTFGYGSDPDPEFLKAISDQANGMFYFMKSPESIPESFADCLGGLLSVVAQNICLTIEAGKHSTISEVTTIYRTVVEQPGKIVKIYIGDLYSEEVRIRTPLRNAFLLLKLFTNLQTFHCVDAK